MLAAVIHRFGPFELDEERFELRRRGKVIRVQRRVLETILLLVRSGGRLVTKDDLVKGPWQGIVVSDAAFSQAIMHARRALTDRSHPAPFIETVRGKGFRFDGVPPADRHDLPDTTMSSTPATTVPARETFRQPAPSEGRASLLVRQALPTADRVKAVARQLGDTARLLDAQLWRAHHLLELGDRAAFAREAAEHDRLARKTRHPVHLFYREVVASARCHQGAKIVDAETRIRRILSLGDAALGPLAAGIAAVHLLNLALEMAGGAREKTLEQSRTMSRACAKRAPGVFLWRSLAAVASLQLGDPIPARAAFLKLGQEVGKLPDDRMLLPCLVNWVDLVIAFREWNRLRDVYERLLPFEGIRVCLEFSDWGPVSFHLGRAARELGKGELCRRHFSRAIAESGAAGAVCWKGWAQYACARALADSGRAGDARRAVGLLGKTAEIARRFDMPALRQASSSLGQPPSPTSFLGRGKRVPTA